MNEFKKAEMLLKVAKELLAKSISSRAKKYLTPFTSENAETYFPKGTNLEILEYTSEKGYPVAIMFEGRSKSPFSRLAYRSERDREKAVKNRIEINKKSMKEKEEERNFLHSLEVDDFLYSSWGYDQTNVSFYQVIEVKPKSVVIREVSSKIVKEKAPSQFVVPVKNKFIGSATRKKVGTGNSVKISSYEFATKWDGKPARETHSQYGR